jgi:hypothetical protein
MNSKGLVKLLVGSLCYCYFSSISIAQTAAPNDPNDAVSGESYITDNLVEDPLSWSGPQSQGDCTYRPDGHGTWANDTRHYVGDWYTNPAYRSCPQISSDGVMRFGWRPEEDMALTNNIDDAHPIIAPYAEALAEAGIMVNGYNYAWTIKSADVNVMQNTLSKGPYDKEGYGYSQDLLSITVEFIGQENQDVVWSKEYEYNYRIENWTKFSGSEAFELNGTDFEKIRITVDGYDAGYWGGYFGPEVMNVQFQLIFTVVETDTCDEDPLSSPTCYGYQDAFNKSIGLPTQAEMLAELESEYGAADITGQSEVTSFFDGGTPDGTSFEYNEEIEAGIEAEIEIFEQEQLQAFEQEQEAQQTGATIDDGQSTGISQEESTGVSQEESTGVSQEESTGVADPVEEAAEAVEEAAAEATAEAVEKPASNVNALSVAQNAEAAGNAVAGSAVNLATGAAITSLNNDIATSTSLNQQSQQQSVQASNTGVAINGSSNNSDSTNTNSSGFSNGSFDGSGDSSTSLSDSIASVNSNVSSFDSQFDIEAASENGQSIFAAEFELASLDQNILDDAINSVINTMLLMQNAAEDNFKEDTSDEGQLTAEEEDALVASAQSGDDSEDAQAALLGYNPNFRAYQTPQMQDVQFYAPKDIYATQKNYDNPNQRFFNGASDATHREMVRQQYGGQ